MEDLKRSVGLNRPFDILGTAEMGFQTKGDFGQSFGLLVGYGRSLFFRFNQILQTDPFFGITDEFFCFFLDFFFQNPGGIVPVNDKKVGDQTAIDHRFTQPGNGVNDDSRRMTFPGSVE